MKYYYTLSKLSCYIFANNSIKWNNYIKIDLRFISPKKSRMKSCMYFAKKKNWKLSSSQTNCQQQRSDLDSLSGPGVEPRINFLGRRGSHRRGNPSKDYVCTDLDYFDVIDRDRNWAPRRREENLQGYFWSSDCALSTSVTGATAQQRKKWRWLYLPKSNQDVLDRKGGGENNTEDVNWEKG